MAYSCKTNNVNIFFKKTLKPHYNILKRMPEKSDSLSAFGRTANKGPTSGTHEKKFYNLGAVIEKAVSCVLTKHICERGWNERKASPDYFKTKESRKGKCCLSGSLDPMSNTFVCNCAHHSSDWMLETFNVH